MADAYQENDKVKERGSEKYKTWTADETNELLRLMVDAANRGWRDNNGSLGKKTVEKKILPVLNAKLGCNRNYSQYLSRLKWFKQRYNNYCKLLSCNSGFGWDPVTKKFTAPDEVWEDYFNEHKLVEVMKSFDNNEHRCWDLIKEIPDLDDRSRFKALKLLNTRAKKIEFIKMTPEERLKWITYELE